MRISVVTPTFNRAHLLRNVHSSLENSTLRPAEWIVVDDGSTDETESVIQGLAESSTFPIVYLKRSHNGGVREATSDGFRLVRKPLVFKLDSDDRVASDGLWRLADSLARNNGDKVVGAVGLCRLQNCDKVIGSRFPLNLEFATAIELSHKYRIGGDKAWLLKAHLLPNAPFADRSESGLRPLLTELSEDGLQFIVTNHVIVEKDYRLAGITVRKTAQAASARGAIRQANADRNRLLRLLQSPRLRRQMGVRGIVCAVYRVARLNLKVAILSLLGDPALSAYVRLRRR